MEVCDSNDSNESDGSISVVCSTIDMNKYSAKYDGYTKIQRLVFIAEKSSNLKVSAFRQLLSELKNGSNFSLYTTISEKLGNDPLIEKDWAEVTKKTFNSKLEELENDLTKAKSSMGKESMRAKYCDLAALHYERGMHLLFWFVSCVLILSYTYLYFVGNLNETLKYLMRAKDYCSLPKQLSDVWLDIVVTSIDLNSFPQALSYIEKTEACLHGSPDKLAQAKLQLSTGLVQLRMNQFKDVAGTLSEVDPCLRGQTSSLASAEDIAVYATLTAVAVLTRREIRRLLEHSKFRQFYENCMPVRVFAQDYLAGNFDLCFHFMNANKPQFLLDIHLSSSVEELYKLITNQIISQYMAPYSVVDLVKMSKRLSLGQIELEKLISGLVSSRKLNGKIDSLQNVFHKQNDSGTHSNIENLLRVAKKNEHDIRKSILRLSLMQHNFTVTETGTDGRSQNAIPSTSDALPPPALAPADDDDVEEGIDEDMTE